MSMYDPDNYFLIAKVLPKGLNEISKPAIMYTFDKSKQKIIIQEGYLCRESWTYIYNELYSSKIDEKNINSIIPTCAGRAGNELEVIRNHIWIYKDNKEYNTPEKRYAAAIDTFIEKEHTILEDLIDKTERSKEYLKYLYTQSKEDK